MSHRVCLQALASQSVYRPLTVDAEPRHPSCFFMAIFKRAIGHVYRRQLPKVFTKLYLIGRGACMSYTNYDFQALASESIHRYKSVSFFALLLLFCVMLLLEIFKVPT